MTVETINVPIYRLPHAPENLPAYQTPGAVGMDLQAAIEEPITLEPMQRMLIPTGLVIMLPEGYEAQVRPRSGLSIKNGLSLINAVGTIDWDYRHELKVPLVNLSTETYTLQPGERIAQMLVAPVTRAVWQEVDAIIPAEGELVGASARTGGFGSTGK